MNPATSQLHSVSLDGLLLVDKPVGMTSHDVIDRLRRITGRKRIGHTGTLDPLASGLMVTMLERGTKLAQFLKDDDKRYRAEIRLGKRSHTFDAEGVYDSPEDTDSPNASPDQIDEALTRFLGEITQRAPLYSAVKVDGKRLYRAARAGEDVAPPERTVRIDEIHREDYTAPTLTLEVRCGAGTYIRSLAHDLGEALGCGAYLAGLRRLQAGRWRLDDAFTLAEIETLGESGELAERLIQPSAALDLPALVIAESFVERVRDGVVARGADVLETVGSFTAGDQIQLLDPRGLLLAIGVSEVGSDSLAEPDKVTAERLYRYLRVI